MNNPLDDLPRLGADQMMPCCKCQRDLLATGVPLFFRYEVKQCGIDGVAVKEHVGLAMQMSPANPGAGLAIADVMGAHKKPIVVISSLPVQNVCHECAMADGEVLQMLSQVE